MGPLRISGSLKPSRPLFRERLLRSTPARRATDGYFADVDLPPHVFTLAN